MANSDPVGRIFLSTPNNHDRFFFLHTFWSPAFDFMVGVPTSKTTELLDRLYNQSIQNTCCYSYFIYRYPTGWIRVCKIRFVSTGENRGKPFVWYARNANPSEVQCIVSRLMMSFDFLLLACWADLSTGGPLIIRGKYPNAPESESELFTVDTSEWQSFTRTLTREISPQLSPEKWTSQLHSWHLQQKW